MGTWAPIQALGQRKWVSIYQPHYLHVSILLGQHSGCGSTVVSCVHFDSLWKLVKEQELRTFPAKHPHFWGYGPRTRGTMAYHHLGKVYTQGPLKCHNFGRKGKGLWFLILNAKTGGVGRCLLDHHTRQETSHLIAETALQVHCIDFQLLWAGRYLKERGGQVLLQVRITQAAVHWETCLHPWHPGMHPPRFILFTQETETTDSLQKEPLKNINRIRVTPFWNRIW